MQGHNYICRTNNQQPYHANICFIWKTTSNEAVNMSKHCGLWKAGSCIVKNSKQVIIEKYINIFLKSNTMMLWIIHLNIIICPYRSWVQDRSALHDRSSKHMLVLIVASNITHPAELILTSVAAIICLVGTVHEGL